MFQCCKSCMHSLSLVPIMTFPVSTDVICSWLITVVLCSNSLNCCLAVECFASASAASKLFCACLLFRLSLSVGRNLSSVFTSLVSPNTFKTFFARVIFNFCVSAITSASIWDGVVGSFAAALSVWIAS